MMISRREWQTLSLYIILLLVLTSIPYLIAQQQAREQWIFNGFLFGIEDGNAYLGKTRLGVEGYWQFHLFYTPNTTHQSAPLLYLPYIASGHLIRLLIDEQDPTTRFSAMIVAFHIFRLLANTVLIIAIYVFSSTFLSTMIERFLAVVLATLGGGWGWLFVLSGQSEWLGNLPPDFHIPEGFGFLVLLGLPHIALARAALLFGFWCLFQSLNKPIGQAWRWAALAGLSWLVVGLGVAFYLAIIYCVVIAWGAMVWLRTRQFPWTLVQRVSIAVVMTWPLFFYFLALFSLNDTFVSWSAQNFLPSPHPLHYIVAYSLFIPLVLVGVGWRWRYRQQPQTLLLIGWVCIVPFLVYLPINVQRRMAEGVIVPLSILAVTGLSLVVARFPGQSYLRRWRLLRTLWLLPAVMTAFLFIVGSSFTAISPERPLFRPQAEITAMDWLALYANEDAIVLSTRSIGNVLAARHNIQVYIGHGPETIDSDTKQRQTEDFFSDEMPQPEQQQLLASVDYIFYGQTERELGNHTTVDTAPAWMASVRLIYDHNGYQIFEVPPQ
jgi:hypothetical protein